MSTIFTASHEAGTLAEYTGTSGADISAAAGAALAGTNYGMNVLCDDGTVDYAYKTISPVNTSGKARARFYFDPNGVVLTNSGDNVYLCTFHYPAAYVAVVEYRNDAGTYKLRASIVNDASGFAPTNYITLTDAPHYIEFYLQRAVTNISSDGRIDIWVDGGSQQTVTGIDNYDMFAGLNYVCMGVRALSGTIAGTLYCDELVVNDDGGAIGPVITSTVNLLSGKLDRRGKL